MSEPIKMVKIYAEVSLSATVEIEVPEGLAKEAEKAVAARDRFNLADLLMGHDGFRETVFESDYDIDSFEIVGEADE